MNDHEAWRPALIAFLRQDGPWFQRIENLRRGDPLSQDDIRMIKGLKAAAERLPVAA